MDKMYIYIGIGVLVVVVVIAVVLILKKKKNKNTNQPIHKEYDASIANMVNNEPIKGGTFIPNDPVNPKEAPMPIPSVETPSFDNNVGDKIETTNLEPTPVVPGVTNVEMNQTPVEVVNQAPTTEPAQPVPTPTVNNNLDPIMPNLSAPVVPNTSEPTVVPVEETQSQLETPAAPVMPDLMAPPAQIDFMAPPAPVDLMAPAQEPTNTNVGMVAEPLIEQEPVVPETPVVPEPTAIPGIPEPVVEEAPAVEAPMPEVAQEVAAPIMQNTEIPTPEIPVVDPMTSVTPDQQKKEPMFVFDMPEEKKSDTTLHQNIEVDVPDMEEMI